ncbi:MAG: hypothetical protein OHK0046_35550 [Anaerolineae bacterium]
MTFDLISMGRSSLDLFGDELGADFADLSGFRAFVGGSPTNVCVAARRLGLRTAMFTGVGDNYVTQFITRFLAREGIVTDFVLPKPGHMTNAVMVALQPPDQMQFVAYGANNADLQLTIADVQRVPLHQARAFQFSGMGLISEPSRSATQYAAETARGHGVTVFMDLDYRMQMWPNAETYGICARVTLPLVDMAVGTEEEVMAAAGCDSVEAAAERLLGLVHKALVVKQGERGSTVYTREGLVQAVPPFRVTVVNFLGAGDAYLGGFIYGVLNEWPLARAARFGNACGAMIVTEHGTANAMPTLEAVYAFIAANGGF